MALKSISQMRRDEIAAAALSVFVSEGVSCVTLERVSREIGASKGIILHYYRSKEELMERVVKNVLKAIGQDMTRALNQSKGPVERLHILISFCVRPDFFTPEYARSFLSILERVPVDPMLARLRHVMQARLRSNLVYGLTPIVGRIEVLSVVESLMTLLDGLWLRRAIAPDTISPERALAFLQTHIDESLTFLGHGN